MKYYSLNNPSLKATFKEAVIAGIAPDKGLYFPEVIRPLAPSFWEKIETYSTHEIAFQALQPFVEGDISETTLKQILAKT